MFACLMVLAAGIGVFGQVAGNDPSAVVRRRSIQQGLSQVSVQCLHQDREGYLWLGTQDGLNRFDGYGFTHYRYSQRNPQSISANDVHTIFEDRKGNFWIGTNGGGINRFDRATGLFTRYQPDPKNPKSFGSPRVDAILEDRAGNLWIATPEGLFRMDVAKGEFTGFRHDPNDPNSLAENVVRDVIEDRQGRLWIATEGGGLDRREPDGRFTHFPSDPKNPNSPFSNDIFSLLEGRDGTIWIGCTDGLTRLDPATMTFTRFPSVENDPTTPTTGRIRDMVEDRAGNLWFGTTGGLNRRTPEGRFFRFVNNPDNPESLSANSTRAVIEDRSGIIWAGTRNGLNAIDRFTRRFPHYKNDPKNPNSLSSNSIFDFYEESPDVLWVATTDGFNRFDRRTGIFSIPKGDAQNPDAFRGRTVSSIVPDQNGRLWLGTSQGVVRYDLKTGLLERFPDAPDTPAPARLNDRPVQVLFFDRNGYLWLSMENRGLVRYQPETRAMRIFESNPADPKTLSNNKIWQIAEDANGRLWIGTSNGVCRFDPATETFERFDHDPNNPKSLGSARVYTLTLDSRGKLWVGLNGGLARLDDPATKTFTNWTTAEGLPSDIVTGILEDREGNLWLSTYAGLCRFNPSAGTFRNYTPDDGVQSTEFSTNAHYKSPSGEMFFGGINGFNAFRPENIADNGHAPPVVVTGFRIFDKPVENFDGANIRTLNHWENFFSFEFAALDFTVPEKNRYAYQLIGFDDHWIECGTRRYASYTNLNPGDYTFCVRGSNNDGLWNMEGVKLKFTIRPPWWRTWWAYASYFFIVVGTAFLGIRLQINRIQERGRLREAQLRSRYAERLAEQNAELAARNDEIEEKNREIVDSIRYAERIQQAMLPMRERLDRALPDHFILYRPKAIVSGDFYWFHETEDGALIVAVADCTGHGVPGALMSMIGTNFLNQIVVEQRVTDPGRVLEALHLSVRRALKQDAADAETLDGMDIAFCRIDRRAGKLDFAGARRPLFVIDRAGTLQQLKGSRSGIGGAQREMNRSFSSQSLELAEVRSIYLTSDGFADQPGLTRGKYGSAALRNLFTRLASVPMRDQYAIIEHELDLFQGDTPQRDDITMLGIRGF